MKRATNSEDTIVAIATPPGEGGVGIVRMSGPRAIAIAASRFRSSRGANPLTTRRRVLHGHVLDAGGGVLDEVLLHIMRAPHSYTREDVVEVNAHGGMGPLNAIVEACLAAGGRLAGPGEFTMRAFMNGRLDLVQAEAVIDTIRARTRAGLQAAQAAASGTLSRRIHDFAARTARALAHIEAAVDFPEEDLPELVTPELFENLRGLHGEMTGLLGTAEAGRLLREGATAAIAGRPNAGKSSLFNALLRENRAIVTAVPGTTRDRLEEYMTLSGVPLKLVDTAGLRAAENEVEAIGVQRAREALEAAQVVLLVTDIGAPFSPADAELAEELAAAGCPVLVVLNKCDLAPDAPTPEWAGGFARACRVSALTGAGLPELERELAALVIGEAQYAADQALVTRAHQKDSLRRAAECVAHTLENAELSPEFLAFDLREALQALGEITGETTPDDLLGRIFSQFCIGK